MMPLPLFHVRLKIDGIIMDIAVMANGMGAAVMTAFLTIGYEAEKIGYHPEDVKLISVRVE